LLQQGIIEVSIAGGLLLLLVLVVALVYFIQTARSIGSRTTAVLEALMVIP